MSRGDSAESSRPAKSPLLMMVAPSLRVRSEEHTSELQSQSNLVCRLLLEKKKNVPHQRRLTHPGARSDPVRPYSGAQPLLPPLGGTRPQTYQRPSPPLLGAIRRSRDRVPH